MRLRIENSCTRIHVHSSSVSSSITALECQWERLRRRVWCMVAGGTASVAHLFSLGFRSGKEIAKKNSKKIKACRNFTLPESCSPKHVRHSLTKCFTTKRRRNSSTKSELSSFILMSVCRNRATHQWRHANEKEKSNRYDSIARWSSFWRHAGPHCEEKERQREKKTGMEGKARDGAHNQSVQVGHRCLPAGKITAPSSWR